MVFESLFTYLILVIIVLLAIVGVQYMRLRYADGDLQLMWCEQFGKNAASLRGKVVWITGASSGIGEYLAYELAHAGARLILSARSEERLAEVKKRCLVLSWCEATKSFSVFIESGQINTDDILILPLDVTNIEAHKPSTDKILAKFGQIDVLVNNAGRSQRAWVWETDLSVDREMIELNVIGQISLTKCVLPHMMSRGQGQIVVTSSVTGKIGFPFSATYCLTKYALQGYFQSLAYELSDKNIFVTIICPGPVVSNFLNVAFTGEPGKTFGGSAADDKSRMTTKRCAELMAVAIANRVHEAWISRQPFLNLYYFHQYLPSIAYHYTRTYGMKKLMAMREGQ